MVWLRSDTRTPSDMSCNLCPLSETCKTLPRYCLLLNYLAVIGLLGTLGYFLFSGAV